MNLGITDLWTYVLGTIFIVLLPGPNSFYVLSVASRSGVTRGYQAAFGIFLGDSLLMLLSATGVAINATLGAVSRALLRRRGAE